MNRTAVLVLLLASGAARAGDAPPEAAALVRDMQHRNVPDGLVHRMMLGMTPLLAHRDHLDQKTAEHLVNDYIGPEMAARYDRQVAEVAEVWAAHFTTDELRGMRDFLATRTPESEQAFQATPLGRKFAAEYPAVDDADRDVTRRWAVDAMHAALEAHAKEVRALGIDPATGEPPAQPAK